MAYATKSDMIARFGEAELIQRTDRADPRIDAIVDSVMDQALNDVSDEIDSYLISKFTPAEISASNIVNRYCCDLARFNLYDDKVKEEVANRRKNAIAWLRDASMGKVSIAADNPGALLVSVPIGRT